MYRKTFGLIRNDKYDPNSEVDFCFGTEGEEGAEDDHCEESYDELERLLSSEIPNLEIGAAENYHVVSRIETEEQGRQVYDKIKTILIENGWTESDDF